MSQPPNALPPLPSYPNGLGRPADDPSMEDILASIRRILNDGEPEPAGPAATPLAAAPAPPAPAPAGDDSLAEDVFVLDQTMMIEEPVPAAMEQPPAAAPEPILAPAAPEPIVAAEPVLEAAPVAEPEPFIEAEQPPEPPPHVEHEYQPAPATHAEPAATPEPPPSAAEPEPLIAQATAAAATASLGALVRVVHQKQTEVYRGGPTLEDMVREELRPMVKAWLDENLPPMVERLVRVEIERVTRS